MSEENFGDSYSSDFDNAYREEASPRKKGSTGILIKVKKNILKKNKVNRV